VNADLQSGEHVPESATVLQAEEPLSETAPDISTTWSTGTTQELATSPDSLFEERQPNLPATPSRASVQDSTTAPDSPFRNEQPDALVTLSPVPAPPPTTIPEPLLEDVQPDISTGPSLEDTHPPLGPSGGDPIELATDPYLTTAANTFPKLTQLDGLANTPLEYIQSPPALTGEDFMGLLPVAESSSVVQPLSFEGQLLDSNVGNFSEWALPAESSSAAYGGQLPMDHSFSTQHTLSAAPCLNFPMDFTTRLGGPDAGNLFDSNPPAESSSAAHGGQLAIDPSFSDPPTFSTAPGVPYSEEEAAALERAMMEKRDEKDELPRPQRDCDHTSSLRDEPCPVCPVHKIALKWACLYKACGALSKSSNSLKAHLRKIHSTIEDPTHCPIPYCRRPLESKHAMTIHNAMIHEKEGRYPFPQCSCFSYSGGYAARSLAAHYRAFH
jgi:hypothetical protein